MTVDDHDDVRALTERSLQRAGEYAGAAAMLSKPFAPKRLLSAVDGLLAA